MIRSPVRALAILAVLLSPALSLGQVTFPVTFNDPGGNYSSYYSAITSNIQAAGARWMQFMTLGGPRSLSIVVGFPNIPTANGGSATSSFVYNNGTYNIFEQGAMAELRTGTDPNGGTQDINFNIGQSYLVNELWFDPNPFQRLDPVPANRTDAVSVFLHEFGHALVFNGWRNGTTGALPGDYASTFDEDTFFDGTNLYHRGPLASHYYGGNVPVTFGNYSHLGNNAPRPGSDLIPDLMNGVVYFRGTRYDVSSLDVMIGLDSGGPFISVPEPATYGFIGSAAGISAYVVYRRRRAAGVELNSELSLVD